MPRSTDAILQELAREQARLAGIERARDEVQEKIKSLLLELAASPPTTPLPSTLAVMAKCGAPNIPSGKVQLFRSLFRGRADIFPTRFVSKKTGNPGYAPACPLEFEPRSMVRGCSGRLRQRYARVTFAAGVGERDVCSSRLAGEGGEPDVISVELSNRRLAEAIC
jgi:hypothetical protein